jgi:hypothetical protein
MGKVMTLSAAVDALLQGSMDAALFREHLDEFSAAMRTVQEQFDRDVGLAAQKMPCDQRLTGKIQRMRGIFDSVDANVAKMRRYFQDGNVDHVRVAFEKINQAADDLADISGELQAIMGPSA